MIRYFELTSGSLSTYLSIYYSRIQDPGLACVTRQEHWTGHLSVISDTIQSIPDTSNKQRLIFWSFLGQIGISPPPTLGLGH